MNKPFICNCGAKKGKHRRDHWCDIWDANGPDETLYEWDDCSAFHAQTDGMDDAEYAQYMGVAK